MVHGQALGAAGGWLGRSDHFLGENAIRMLMVILLLLLPVLMEMLC